eukprot:403359361
MDRARTTYQSSESVSQQKKFRNLRRYSSYNSTPPEDVPIQAFIGLFIIGGIAFIIMTICIAKLFCKYEYREGKAKVVCKSMSENICKGVVPEHKLPNSILSQAKTRGTVGEPRMEIMQQAVVMNQALQLNQIQIMSQQIMANGQVMPPPNAFNGGQYPSANIQGMPNGTQQYQPGMMMDNQPAMGMPVSQNPQYSNLPPIQNPNSYMQNPSGLPNSQNLMPLPQQRQESSNLNSQRDRLDHSQMGLLQNQTQLTQGAVPNNNYGQYQPQQQQLNGYPVLQNPSSNGPYVLQTNINQDANGNMYQPNYQNQYISAQLQPQYQAPQNFNQGISSPAHKAI